MSTAGRTAVVFVAVVVGFVIGSIVGLLAATAWDPAGENILVSNGLGTVLALIGAGVGLVLAMRATSPPSPD